MIQGPFRKGNITSWLLPMVLVLSLFTFSGISTPSSPKHHKTTTEQIDLLRVTNKKTASFKFSCTTEAGLTSCNNSPENPLLIAFDHNRVVKTQIDRCAKKCLRFNVLSRLLHPSQRTSNEDSIIPQLG